MATVVLIHGIWMNGWDMTLLRHRIRKAGFNVAQFSYSSITKDFSESAVQLQGFLSGIEDDEIHLVAHSLGGLLIRQLFHDFPAQKPGRIVTLGTPHSGSVVARRLVNYAFGRVILGKSAQSGLLGNAPEWKAAHEIGVIAGDRSLGVGMFLGRLPKPNDGTVVLAETVLQGMKDYKVMHTNHMGMVFSKRVSDQIIHFLLNGRFARESLK